MSYSLAGTCDVTYTSPYRTPSEIRRDMQSVAEKIESMEEKLNLRDAVVSMAATAEKPETLIRELEDLVADAQETLEELETLRGDLSLLGEELDAAREAFRGWRLP